MEAKDLFKLMDMDLLRGTQHTVQDKAKFETLRELGCSPEEFLALNVGDVEPIENDALIHLHNGKHPSRDKKSSTLPPCFSHGSNPTRAQSQKIALSGSIRADLSMILERASL